MSSPSLSPAPASLDLDMKPQWRSIPLALAELSLPTVLRNGQSFRWRLSGPYEYTISLSNRILSVTQTSTALHYRTIFRTPPKTDDTPALLHSYFNLSHSVPSLYAQWSAADPHFRALSTTIPGIRILNQPSFENLCAFICSSNNNISRISQMVQNLCTHFGPYLGSLNGVDYHDFPDPSALAVDGTEAKLRSLGFGYRAKYIANSAQILVSKPDGWLESLRSGSTPYREAREALLELPGVGPKVADCVCLMGLGHLEAVPVDTHVWTVARRDYGMRGKGDGKSMAKGVYDAVGEHFRGLWGEKAGWAQSVMFTGELRELDEAKLEVRREVKTEVKEEEDGEVISKRRKVKVEIKQEEAPLEMTGKKVVKTRKRKVKTEEKENIQLQLDEDSASLADRIKRRRRG